MQNLYCVCFLVFGATYCEMSVLIYYVDICSRFDVHINHINHVIHVFADNHTEITKHPRVPKAFVLSHRQMRQI